MQYAGLFYLWTIVIAGGTVFLTAISVYIYLNNLKKMRHTGGAKMSIAIIGKDFVFVWILLGLLVLYVVSIGSISGFLFAVGNIIVEAVLLIYVLKNRTRKSVATHR
jgi:hypothetical protein